MISFLKSNKGIAIGVISLLVLLIFSIFPWLADTIYREFIFQVFRVIWDYTIGLLPFPVIYLLLIALPFILFFYGRKFERKKITLLLFPLNLIGWIITFFLWMWGYNYCATPLISSDTQLKMTVQDLYSFGLEVAEEVNLDAKLRDFTHCETRLDAVEISYAVEQYLEKKGRQTWGWPKSVVLNDNGFIRRMGISGIYIPFAGQGHSTATHPCYVNVFVLAHETSHAYGITGEGEADYVAYQALGESGLSGSYAAQMIFARDLELLRSIRSVLYYTNDSLRVELDSTLSDEVLAHLKMIKENQLLYPEFFPGMQHTMNDTYLKMMGMEDGILNYDRFVEMVWNDRKRNAEGNR